MAKILLMAMALFYAGCASIGGGNQKIMDASFMDRIQVGVTTKAEVLALLGPPMSLFDPVWKYQGDDRVIPPLCYVPLIDLLARQTVAEQDGGDPFQPEGRVGCQSRIWYGEEDVCGRHGLLDNRRAGSRGGCPLPGQGGGHYHPHHRRGQFIHDSILQIGRENRQWRF